jgi:hypothetical protein
MADETDVLLDLWKGQRDEARQMGNQRATLTNIVIIVAAAALGFLAQRWAVHSGLADALRLEVGLLHPGLTLPELIERTQQSMQRSSLASSD